MTDQSQSRHLALVVGPGRSGTSLLAGVCSELGFHVPQPEVRANTTNPKGFGEPRWVVDFHARLMTRAKVSLFDARPVAWQEANSIAGRPKHRTMLREWLAHEHEDHDMLVVKDPRTAWFLQMWESVAADVGSTVAFLTPLRHPTEVLTSVRTTAKDRQPEASRAAWWINMVLGSEHATRGSARAYLMFDEILTDWRTQLARAEESSGLRLVSGVSPETLARVDAFLDPSLRRSPKGWEQVEVPARVRDLAEEVWAVMGTLARDPAAASRCHQQLDELRRAYDQMYGEAEAISFETARAAAAVASAKARDKGKQNAAPSPPRRQQQSDSPGRVRGALRRLSGN